MVGMHRQNGKKQMAVRIFRQALEIIHLLTGLNPLEVLFEAIVQGGAREDSTRIGSGGTVRRQAVDVSPLRRVNQAIYLICKGSREASFRSHKAMSETLADEIIAASKGVGQSNSFAVRKKDEIERVAKGNRWSRCLEHLYVLGVIADVLFRSKPSNALDGGSTKITLKSFLIVKFSFLFLLFIIAKKQNTSFISQ